MTRIQAYLHHFLTSAYHRLHDETRALHRHEKKWPSLFFVAVGILSLIWLALRSGRKPSRLNYPCQRIASANSVIFISWVAAVFTSLLARHTKHSGKLILRSLLVLTSIGFLFIALNTVYTYYNHFTFVPFAVGQSGSRVVWIQQEGAAAGWSSNFASRVNSQIADSMMDAAVTKLTDQSSVRSAWSQLFRNHNSGRDYQSGETIAIKVNFNNSHDNNLIDANSQVVNALLRQLINEVGVSPSNITVYDVSRPFPGGFSSNISGRFPGVNLNTERNVCGDGVVGSARLGCILQNTTYLINMPLLKVHGDGVKVSMSLKNHFGSSNSPSTFHGTMYDPSRTNSQIVINKHPWIKNKTILVIGDGIYGTKSGTESSSPTGSTGISPYPNSIFMSTDPIALDSVMIDFIANQPSTKISGNNLSWVQQLYQNAALEGLGTFDHSSSYNYSRIQLIRCINGDCGSSGPIVTPTTPPTTQPTAEPTTEPTSEPTTPPTTEPTTPPTSNPNLKPGDINQDGMVDLTDYSMLVSNFLKMEANNPADINQDGIVDLTDYSILVTNFLQS